MKPYLHFKFAPYILLIFAGVFLLFGGIANADADIKAVRTQILVTSTADSGPGTLREALLGANHGDTIKFSPATFPVSNPVTITLSAALPAITKDSLTIDASDAGVILNGKEIDGGAHYSGLDIRADHTVIYGLRIRNFSGCGIEIHSSNNTIGGMQTNKGNLINSNKHSGICLFEYASFNDINGNLIGVDETGLGAVGEQGDGVHIYKGHHNIIENNIISSQKASGVQIYDLDSAYNTVKNNLIGVGKDGITPIPCFDKGVNIHDGAHHNQIGPGNIIANTAGSYGIQVGGGLSPSNTITKNSIFSNEGVGILLWNENISLIRPPAITSFNLNDGTISGLACSNCLVQIFSDEDNEGKIFEGETTADTAGIFTYDKDSPFAGPHLTATATDESGTSSAFSIPTVGAASIPLQAGNTNPYSRFNIRKSNELPNNRIGFYIQEQGWVDSGMMDANVLNYIGVSHARGQMNDPDSYLVNWETDELEIHENFDQLISDLTANHISMEYILIFWDKAYYRQHGYISIPRFQTEDDIQRYLDFVRTMVRAFGDRVDYWEPWNEPSFEGSSQGIEVNTYISLAKRVIPIIREEDPGAKIVIASFHGWHDEFYKEYLLKILEDTELMQMVDIVSWHPFLVHFDFNECWGEFVHRYPQVLSEIKTTALEHGFQGEFSADEIRFAVRTPSTTTACAVFDRTSGKYYAREIVRHLGEDVRAGTIMNGDWQGWMVIQNLATLMAGAKPSYYPANIISTSDVVSYTFSTPLGDELLAVWNYTDITDEETGTSITLQLPEADQDATINAIDVLNGIQQPLITSWDGEKLIVDGLIIRDYPIIVRIAPRRTIYLPLVIRK